MVVKEISPRDTYSNFQFYLLIFVFSILSLQSPLATCLRFAHNPVTVDTQVLVVDQPSRLQCNYIKFRTEKVHKISWFIGYQGFKTKIFAYDIPTSYKEVPPLDFIRVDSDAATNTDLTITLKEFRNSNMTVACEIEVMRDNGYGKLKHSKKRGESVLQSINNKRHKLLLKADPIERTDAVPNQALGFFCLSRGTSPPPQLFLLVGGRNIEDIYGGSVQRIQANDYSHAFPGLTDVTKEWDDENNIPIAYHKSETTAIKGHLNKVTEDMFDRGFVKIECLAYFDELLFDRKELALERKGSSSYYTPAMQPTLGGTDRRTSEMILADRILEGKIDTHIPIGKGQIVTQGRPRALGLPGSRGYQNTELLRRLMDPARSGFRGYRTYDTFAGYILVISDSNNLRDLVTSYSSTGEVVILGELSFGAKNALQLSYGQVAEVSPGLYRLPMSPIKVLNLLGSEGYRVVGQAPVNPSVSSAGPTSGGMVWTLEQRIGVNQRSDESY